MKTILIASLTFAAIGFTACNGGNNKSKESQDTSQTGMKMPGMDNKAAAVSPMAGIITGYLQIKNALAGDDGKAAADGGKALGTALGNFDQSSLTDAQKQLFKEALGDIKENAEHISENAGDTPHQREHFDMLSQDMYALVKSIGAGQLLYKDYCPMYNNKKGAFWLSETKEIKNPYLGKKMPDCGEVKEEIKGL